MKTATAIVIISSLAYLLGWYLGDEMRPKIAGEHRKLIAGCAEKLALDPNLVEAVAMVESQGDPAAVSGKGAIGLLQLCPATAEELTRDLDLPRCSREDLFSPEINIRLGSYYLYSLVDKFQGDLPLALAAYNTGPNRVDRWVKQRPDLSSLELVRRCGSRETRSYVARVLAKYGHTRTRN